MIVPAEVRVGASHSCRGEPIRLDFMLQPDQLAALSLFGALPGQELVALSRLLEERIYEANAVVVEEGTPGRELYVIEEGSVAVSKRTADGRVVELGKLGAGDCFGEMALVGIMRRTATVRAQSRLTLLVLSYASIAELAKERPHSFTLMVMNLARELCRRLRQADAVLAECGITGSTEPLVESALPGGAKQAEQ